MAERAREARKALGDGFQASPRVTLGALCDFCPDQPEQVLVMARFLRSPDAAACLVTLAAGALPNDASDSHELQWCKRLLGYACGITDTAPSFTVETPGDSLRSSSAPVRRASSAPWVYVAAGLIVVVVAAVLFFNRGATKPPRTQPQPSPQTSVNTAPVPENRQPVVIPPAPSSDYPPELGSGSDGAGRTSPRESHTRARPQRDPSSGSEPIPQHQQHRESPAPKPPELRQREKPPEESGE